MVCRSFIALMVTVFCSTVYAGKYPGDYFSPPTQQYPIVTENMVAAVGEIDMKLEYPVLRSVAVVGGDEISAHWLRLNNDYLVSIGAIGLVVNVESEPFVIDKSAGRVRQ